ncbi:MAG: Ig-like domain-containing protein, partial [Verrucomicrobia bacterium]|nr:Ig-like domain-containing protein [Verrucomicrobiota bacterium]
MVTVDGMLGNIFKLIERDAPTMIGRTVIILTADHGNQDNPPTGADRYSVPFFVWGPGVAAGADLYALNPSNRKVASTYPMTTYSGIQPIRNAEANNLALEFLGLGPIPGSVFGFAQDLAVNVMGPLQPPQVTITNPVNNASIIVGASIPVEASASDSDGTVTNVVFYADGSLLGSDATAPYSYTWTTAALGAHTLSAIAWDNTGLSTTSAVVNLTVTAPPPYRSFTSAPITESFDGLGTGGTSLSLLIGWNAGHFNPSIQQGTTGGNGVATVTDPVVVDDGSHDPGGTPMIANFGTTGSADRALGSFARTTPAGDQFLQLAIRNDATNPITSFTLSYRGEEWRSCNAAAQALTMWYSTDPVNGFVSMGSGFTFNSPNNSGS